MLFNSSLFPFFNCLETVVNTIDYDSQSKGAFRSEASESLITIWSSCQILSCQVTLLTGRLPVGGSMVALYISLKFVHKESPTALRK